jgi:hypothetical protein
MNKDHFLIALSESKQTNFGRIDFSAQPEAQKVFSAMWELESQVNNGGFEQYFRNSDADIITYAPEALRAVGALSCAGVVSRAIEVIAPLPLTLEGRRDALDALDPTQRNQLATLDDEFLAYPDNLTEKLFEFVRQHPEAFGTVPHE